MRQSGELFRKVRGFAGQPSAQAPAIIRESALQLEFTTGSRIISLPGNENTVRGYSAVDTLIVDEAAFTRDELLNAVSPMLAVSDGQLIAISSANFEMGWFWQAYTREQEWLKWKVVATENPRIKPEFLAAERKRMTLIRYEAEYMCKFISADMISVFRREDIDKALAANAAWKPRLNLDFLKL